VSTQAGVFVQTTSAGYAIYYVLNSGVVEEEGEEDRLQMLLLRVVGTLQSSVGSHLLFSSSAIFHQLSSTVVLLFYHLREPGDTVTTTYSPVTNAASMQSLWKCMNSMAEGHTWQQKQLSWSIHPWIKFVILEH
jgi:hypothetical protein